MKKLIFALNIYNTLKTESINILNNSTYGYYAALMVIILNPVYWFFKPSSDILFSFSHIILVNKRTKRFDLWEKFCARFTISKYFLFWVQHPVKWQLQQDFYKSLFYSSHEKGNWNAFEKANTP